jgi:transcriptional regulator with XRE-family HTH domain
MYSMNTTPAPNPETPRSEIVAARLRAALAVMGISKSAAARKLEWSQSNFDRQSKGLVKLSIDQLDWIEKRLGIPMAYLLGFTDELPTYGGRALRPVGRRTLSEPAEVLFDDGSGSHETTASGESFLRESNSRPFHYREHASVILPFRLRSRAAASPCDQNAQILPFPVAVSL